MCQHNCSYYCITGVVDDSSLALAQGSSQNSDDDEGHAMSLNFNASVGVILAVTLSAVNLVILGIFALRRLRTKSRADDNISITDDSAHENKTFISDESVIDALTSITENESSVLKATSEEDVDSISTNSVE